MAGRSGGEDRADGGAEPAWGASGFAAADVALAWLVAATAARQAVSDDDPIAVASAELHLGMLGFMLSRYEDSAGHYAACTDQARRAGWVEGEAVALNNRASAFWHLGQAAETIELLTEALDAHRRTGRRAGEAVTIANIAAARLQFARSADAVTQAVAISEQRHEALRLLGQARDIHQALHDRRNEAETCRRIAEAYRDLGDLQQAAAHARQAVTLAREVAVQRFEISEHGLAGPTGRGADHSPGRVGRGGPLPHTSPATPGRTGNRRRVDNSDKEGIKSGLEP